MRLVAATLTVTALFASEPSPPGDLLRVGNRKVHVHCTGAGETPVVLVSGIPRFSFHFAPVQSEVAKFARVCAYDKGGEAWSAPLPALTADEMIRELDAVVQHAGGGKAVVIAGHSFGGILARAYYAGHPQKVRGLVLIDTPHPDMIVMPVNGQRKKMYELTESDMQTVAEAGRNRRAQAPPPEAQILPPFDRLSSEQQQSHLWAMKKAADASRDLDPLVVLKVQSDFARRIREQRFDVPTVVITRAKTAEESNPWVDSQQRLAAAATNGKLLRAVGSGHDIQLEQPAIIVDAIRELVGSGHRGVK